MLSPEDYIHRVKATLTQSPVIATWTMLNETILSNRGHIRVRLTLQNGDFVEASEFFYFKETGIEQQRYRYQWMDSTKTKLRKRWDNAPHFPEIATFPHHVHVEQEDKVFPSTMLGILDLVALLESAITDTSAPNAP
ncbi:hypothetical protein GFS31_40360 (plasmid) [Leptolyngbya sp. BL0902]|uniref:toxin-antitoxin system TumE family protein n=1 Tax=Leptolyngbya sp. BL0902 TaxID=1115757 RepID=UPI0018E72DED|nr:DUF6516 family protein [Leptolyngbya sp. BL0902]QQE67323.1 hypothetical protein GFS31_40360 [Leptolyngbya sp. BL0902]